ncbi:uncharacterized protein [Macrobrachium rosenbergii]|uniref:uncharacterized protein isoform X3 n=1 Tax=Macrobrachium rosenbergii TaxID=79674 RepID=UPI0034D66D01
MKQDTLKMKINLKNAMEVIERMTEGGEQEERDSVVNITVTDLLSPDGHLRLDAQRETYVVMTFEGKLWVAPVKIESYNQVSVSHLEERALPQRCFVIELECLMQWVSFPFQGRSWIWHMNPPTWGGSSSRY